MRHAFAGSRLGVLLEINCETDFVAVSDQFRTLLKGVSMQIAASPSVQYVSQEDIPAADFAKEIEIEMGREDLQSKPEAIRSKIAEGRVKKMLQVGGLGHGVAGVQAGSFHLGACCTGALLPTYCSCCNAAYLASMLPCCILPSILHYYYNKFCRCPAVIATTIQHVVHVYDHVPQEQVLLEQPYLMDQDKTVAEAVKEAVATIGENIQIRRFVRFTLGEGLEKKVNDLAADVAAATGKQ